MNLSSSSFLPAVENPPFEIHESGWGEFEILIKIHFHDQNEKIQTLHHHLQLYPKEEGGIDMKKSVTAEFYDEIVFNETSEETGRILDANPVPKNGTSIYNDEFEKIELDRLVRAKDQVFKLYEDQREALNKTDELLKIVKREINLLLNE